MKQFLLLVVLVLGLSPTTCFASSWQQVAALTISGCDECLAELAVSPSGKTVVIAHNSTMLLYEKPAVGWSDAANPTTLLTCSDPNVFAIGVYAYGLATNDGTVIGEAYKNVRDGTNTQETQVLLVWQEPADGWGSQQSVSQSFELEATGLAQMDWNSVAVDAHTIAVGARSDSQATGAVYVWNNPPDTHFSIAELTASDGRTADNLGWTLSLSGDTVTTGTCPESGFDRQGAIYIFVKPPTGWVTSIQTAELKYPPDDRIGFGCYVASNSDTVAAGDSSYNNNEGQVEIFEKPSSGWSDSSTPTAKIKGSSSTGPDFGITVNFGENSAGDEMLVASSPDLNGNDAAENIYYKPKQGWGSISNSPNYTILDPDTSHFDLNGRDGAGTNTVVFADCTAGGGCGSPVHVYQYR
jgi:hypothetical protein